MVKIVGVDYSISSPAICILGPAASFVESSFFFLTSRKRDLEVSSENIKCELHKDYSTEQERYDHISNSCISFIESHGNHSYHIIIEDYAMGAKGKVFNIAEATGLFKHKVHQRGWKLTTVPPTVNKKTATGKGNADKQAMYQAYSQLPQVPNLITIYNPLSRSDKVNSPVSDIVDSYFLARYGFTFNKM
jgi:Holliday junction resolvasome RuvABC endonuclease subunit